jgi:hypothetical protein
LVAVFKTFSKAFGEAIARTVVSALELDSERQAYISRAIYDAIWSVIFESYSGAVVESFFLAIVESYQNLIPGTLIGGNTAWPRNDAQAALLGASSIHARYTPDTKGIDKRWNCLVFQWWYSMWMQQKPCNDASIQWVVIHQDCFGAWSGVGSILQPWQVIIS